METFGTQREYFRSLIVNHKQELVVFEASILAVGGSVQMKVFSVCRACGPCGDETVARGLLIEQLLAVIVKFSVAGCFFAHAS